MICMQQFRPEHKIRQLSDRTGVCLRNFTEFPDDKFPQNSVHIIDGVSHSVRRRLRR